jgi:hypothetical protein
MYGNTNDELGDCSLTCNPSYSGSRDQGDHSSKPALANILPQLISKTAITVKGWWSGSSCRPCIQTPVPQKKNTMMKSAKNYFKK